ncbi:MAG: hypothetical protein WAQ08_04580 [Aquabacterium sp.]|jgi:uncharacterized protein|uniref:hypothetical protein n=1 Tax=Aquabacterium sp. TaxID=1872578 RepID=UPI003BB01FC8
MDTDNPFHEGEEHLQSLAGVREALASRGRAFIRGHMPDQHRSFFAQLPFVIAGGLDGTGQPWATVWAGPSGFMQSPDRRRLGIEPHTRRRNRMNGTLARRQWCVRGRGATELRQLPQVHPATPGRVGAGAR